MKNSIIFWREKKASTCLWTYLLSTEHICLTLKELHVIFDRENISIHWKWANPQFIYSKMCDVSLYTLFDELNLCTFFFFYNCLKARATIAQHIHMMCCTSNGELTMRLTLAFFFFSFVLTHIIKFMNRIGKHSHFQWAHPVV